MKRAAQVLLLVALLAPAACVRTPAGTGTGAGQVPVREALTALDGTPVSVPEMETSIQQAIEKANVAGLSVAIINDGRIAYTHAFGYRDKAAAIPFDTQTVTGAASLSKTVFAYLVMLLAEEGVIDLDKPLWEYLPKPLPDYPAYADLAGDERYKQITARMVLSHSTGFPNWRWLEPDGRLKFLFAPGSRYCYSGEGIALLQMIVEQVTGRDLETLAREKVFAPLGMTHTSYVWQRAFEGKVAEPHDVFGRTQRLAQFLRRRSRADAAGSMVTTAEDYASLLAAIMNASGQRKATMDEMLRPQIAISSEQMFGPGAWVDTNRTRGIGLAWGLGWGRFESAPGRAFFHTGHDAGYQNYTVTYPDKGIGIVLLSNSDNFESVAAEILRATIGDVFTPFDWLGYFAFAPAMTRAPSPDPLVFLVLMFSVVVALAAGAVALRRRSKRRADPAWPALRSKHPEGYWMGRGLALAVALFVPLGWAMNNLMGNDGSGLAIGPAVAAVIGVATGAALERRHKGETRPRTSYEKRARGWMVGIGIATVVVVAALAALGVVARLWW
jgi:CubicO group peptidase (beta-lactamase class C family)